MSTNNRDARPITITAIAHCGNNTSDSTARTGVADFCITENNRKGISKKLIHLNKQKLEEFRNRRMKKLRNEQELEN